MSGESAFHGNGAMSRGLSTYTEILACLAFSRHGYEVAVPLPLGTAQSGWDLLVKFAEGEPYRRIQVKAARVKRGRAGVRTLKRAKHNPGDVKQPYEGHEFDFLLAVHAETGNMWLLPMAEVSGQRFVLLEGRRMWVGKDEWPKLQEIVLLSRLLKAEAHPDQVAMFPPEPGREPQKEEDSGRP